MDDIKIELYKNNKGKKYIKKIIKNIDEDYGMVFINRWLEENNEVLCYNLCVNNEVVCFCILSKMDFDPLNTYKNPYTLEYIYTFKNHRRNGYGLKMLEYLKSKLEITAFCCNKPSVGMFFKAKYITIPSGDWDNVMFRTPILKV